jgi:hypothetical protein
MFMEMKLTLHRWCWLILVPWVTLLVSVSSALACGSSTLVQAMISLVLAMTLKQ